METEADHADHERRCRVAGVHDHSVMLDPGSGKARFLLPRRLVPEEVEVGDRLHVSMRHVPGSETGDDAGTGQIFDQALEALEGLDSSWERPGLPSDASAASA